MGLSGSRGVRRAQVAGHAHHHHAPRLAAAFRVHAEPAPDRLLAPEVALAKRARDDRHVGTGVPRLERSSTQQRQAERLEGALAGAEHDGPRAILRSRRRAPGHVELQRRLAAQDRQRLDGAGRRGSGQASQPAEQPVVEAADARRVLVALLWQVEAERDERPRVEAPVLVDRGASGAHQERRPRHERARERQLRHDQQHARPLAAHVGRPAAAGFPKRLAGVVPQGVERRPGAERERRQQRQHGREQHDARLDDDQREDRLVADRADHAHHEPGDRQAGDPAGRPEQGALGEELAQDPARARADRRADRELAPPHDPARQHQVGDVGAGDGEDAGDDDAEQREDQQRAAAAHQRLARGQHAGLEPGVGVGMLLLQLPRDARDLGRGARDRRARRQAAGHPQPPLAPRRGATGRARAGARPRSSRSCRPRSPGSGRPPPRGAAS